VGKSAPPPANVDLVHSYARQVGEEVEIVLSRPEVELAPDDVVVLRQGTRRVPLTAVVTGEGDSRRVTARAPRADLGRGTWGVALRTSTGRTPLGCRLLVQGGRPLVLLWGDDPAKSRLPEPNPRRAAPPSQASWPRRLARRALRGRPREIASALSRRVRRSS
jgi:hypothetical protein